jgi:hypothetical protein
MQTKKEIVQAYKQMTFRIGVFQIRNIVNGKIFVEGSSNLDKIWNRHRTELNFGSHQSKALQTDWNELGESNFAYEILGEIEQKEGENIDYTRDLKALEQLYLEELTPYGEKGYNHSPKP